MVKKAAQAIPNQRLRRARMERGWTQQAVADRIGAPNDVIITRWERGTAFPSAYYVERLCHLFEQKASDLGLLRGLPSTIASHHLPRSQSRSDSPEASMRPSSRQDFPRISSLPLVGRKTDMHTLQALYQNVQQGQMQVALMQGETGIGKTHLASAFLHWAATQEATVLQGRAFEMGGRLPYQPLAHALGRRLEAEPVPEALLSTTWLSELSRILPELRERSPSLPEVLGYETTARLRLFEAVARLLQAFCERGPVVLFIDDVQWADTASLDVLHYAGQRWSERDTPLLLLLSMRSETLATTTPLSKWLASVHHDLPVTELTLGPLTQDETRLLLATLGTGHAPTAEQHDHFTELERWLFRETRGQPFFLVETLKMLVERQVLVLPHSSKGEALQVDLAALKGLQELRELAPNVRRLILSRLERLTMTGRTLARSCAILGQETTFDVLSRVANLAEEEALVALEELLRQGLLREASEEHSEPFYLFGHDRVREVIVTEMGEAQRRLLHRRALVALEALARPAAELAHHARAGGLMEQAVRFSLRAGEEAARLLANAEASLHYSQALEALSHLSETADTRVLRVETLLKLVQVSWATVDVEDTLGRMAEAEELAQTLSHRGQVAQIHYWIAYLYGLRTDMRQALEHAQRVLMEAQELGDEELAARASLLLSSTLVIQGRHGPIERLLTPVIPVLERRERWLEWTSALGHLGIALAAQGQYVAGRALAQRALEHARRSGDMKGHRGLMSHLYLGYIDLHSGDFTQMLWESRQAVEEAESLGDWFYVYLGHGLQGWAQSRLGLYEEGLWSMERARAISQKLGGQMLLQDSFAAVTAELLLAAGRVEEALAHAEAVVEEARQVDGILSAGLAQRVWGQALPHLARWQEAETHLKASVELLLSGEALQEAARTHMIWGLLCRNRGDQASAQRHFEQAAAQFETSEMTRELEIVQRYLG